MRTLSWLGFIPKTARRRTGRFRMLLILQGPGVFDIEFRTIGPLDGRTRWIAARGRAVREHGRTIRFIGTVRDITEKQAGRRGP